MGIQSLTAPPAGVSRGGMKAHPVISTPRRTANDGHRRPLRHVLRTGPALRSGSTGRESIVTPEGGPENGDRALALRAPAVQEVSHPHSRGAGSLPGPLRPARVARKVSTITIRP